MAMKAIERLRKSGMTTAQLADGIGCSEHLVRLYERHKRFPGREKFTCIVEMAESRGLLLTARDFLPPAIECEASDS